MPSVLEGVEPVTYKGRTYYRQKDLAAKVRPDSANPKEKARYYRVKMTEERKAPWGECLYIPGPDGSPHLTWCVTPEEAEVMAKKMAKKRRVCRNEKIRCVVSRTGMRFYPVIDILKAKKPYLRYPEDEVRRIRIRLAIATASKQCGKYFYLCEGEGDTAVKTWCVTDWSRFEVEQMIEGKTHVRWSEKLHAGS